MGVPSLSTANRPDKPKKLMDQVRDVLRLKHYSLRTERSYCDWIERFIRFHQLRHPKEMGEAEVSSSPNWREMGRLLLPLKIRR